MKAIDINTDDTSSGDDDALEPVKLHTIYNSKISRAMWFVKNNKVHLDTLHNVYQIVDEKNKTHQVTLLPKPSRMSREQMLQKYF